MDRKSLRKSRKIQRRADKIIVIAAEGGETEPRYFNHLESLIKTKLKKESEFAIVVVPTSYESAPEQVLKRMKRYLNKFKMRNKDEAWLIVDRNSWPIEKLKNLVDWADSDNRFNLALSNPCFEYWLLLHFERGKRNQNCKYYTDRLRKHQKNYKKKIAPGLYKLGNIQKAVELAQENQNAKSTNCLNDSGCTTVYRIVKKLLEEYGS